MMDRQCKSGISIVDITPSLGMELAGYPHYPRNNTGVHDPLYASCLYLESGDEKLAIVGLDILFFSRKHVLRVREEIAERIGIPPRNIMICCSHSHSTPWASGRLDAESLLADVKQDDEFIDELCGKLVNLVVSASRVTFECSVGFDKTRCGKERNIGGNRRDPENGPCDPYVYVLSVKDSEGTVRGVYVNYAVHPTLLHEDNTLCSADYPGYIRRYLRERYPHAVMIFGLGASGDQSSRYFREGQSFDEARRYGDCIAEAAARVVDRTRFVSHARLSVKTAEADFQLRELPDRMSAEKHVALCKEKYETLIKQDASYLDIQNANVTLLGAEDILGYIVMREKGQLIELVEAELPAELSLFSIGDIFIAGIPGEIFNGISHEVRKVLGQEKLIINTVTNGCLPGYAYTREDLRYGGYEVDTSMLDENTGDIIVQKLIELSE